MMDFYGTADGLRAYCAQRDIDLPPDAAEDDFVNSKLLLASETLDGRYRPQFPGLKVGMRAQIREWPRNAAYDRYGYPVSNESVPLEIINATYELAIREMKSPGVLAADYTPNPYKSVSVDGAVSVQFATFNEAGDIQTQFVTVDQILSALLCDLGSSPLSGSTCRV